MQWVSRSHWLFPSWYRDVGEGKLRKRAKRLAAQVLDGADPSAIRRIERQERIDLAFDAYVSRFLKFQMVFYDAH